MKLICVSILVFVIANCGNQPSIGRAEYDSTSTNKFSNEEPSSYQGSQAYNNSLFTTENVSGNSGSLSISKSLINVPGVAQSINLSLNLIYSSGGISAFHMPKGWGLQLSYVISGKSVNIDGSNYVIDYNWVDENGYKSGLKYVNNHSIYFVRNYYDEFGRVAKSIDGLNNITTIEYDDAKLKTTTYLNGKIKGEKIQDAVGNLVSITSYANDSKQNATTINTYNGFKQNLSSIGLINGTTDTTTGGTS